MKVLVTGGAGFIGGYVVDMLLGRGHEVVVLDNLEKPTHSGIPDYLPKEVKFIRGDVRNRKDVLKSLSGVEVVLHQAATGGFTPSITEYIDSNSLGTANLLELIVAKNIPVKKFIVASSIAVYGEGKYRCRKHGIVYPPVRPEKQLMRREWEMKCPECGLNLVPLQTDEEKPVSPETIYSVSKYDEERISLIIGRKYGIPTVALRYFVTYGPRQSLLNPYTGVCSIFSTRILNGKPPVIFEDGMQTRDFVYVKDVAKANMLAMNKSKADYNVYNVGTGRGVPIIHIAEKLIKAYGKSLKPHLSGEFRPGEVRHMVADISRIKKLGFKPEYDFDRGIEEYVKWIKKRGGIREYFSAAERILRKSRTIVKAR